MTPEQNQRLATIITDFFDTLRTPEASHKHIGHLNKAQGFNGFKKAEIGTPVFETSDRYSIFLESLDGKTSLEVKYYKETLHPVIDMFGN